MRTAGIRDQDVVLVDRRGRRFEAIISGREPDGRRFSIRPLRPAISYMSVGARDIVAHWRARPLWSGKVSTSPIRPGDVVSVGVVHGDDTPPFFGTVLAKNGSRLRVRSLECSAQTQVVLMKRVVRHYARQGRARNGS